MFRNVLFFTVVKNRDLDDTLSVCVGHEQIVYQNYDSIGNIIPHRLTILHLSYYIFNEKKKK